MEIHEQFKCWTSEKTTLGTEDMVDENEQAACVDAWSVSWSNRWAASFDGL